IGLFLVLEQQHIDERLLAEDGVFALELGFNEVLEQVGHALLAQAFDERGLVEVGHLRERSGRGQQQQARGDDGDAYGFGHRYFLRNQSRSFTTEDTEVTEAGLKQEARMILLTTRQEL